MQKSLESKLVRSWLQLKLEFFLHHGYYICILFPVSFVHFSYPPIMSFGTVILKGSCIFQLKYHDTGREKDCLPQVGQWNMMNKVFLALDTLIYNFHCLSADNIYLPIYKGLGVLLKPFGHASGYQSLAICISRNTSAII